MEAKKNTSWQPKHLFPKYSMEQDRTCLQPRRTNEKKNLNNTLYRLEHVYKQMQNDNIDKIHFEMFCVPIWTSVPLNEDRKLEQNEHCIVRVPNQPSVHQYGHKQNTRNEHKFHVPTVRVPIHPGGLIELKLQNLPKQLTTKATKKMILININRKNLFDKKLTKFGHEYSMVMSTFRDGLKWTRKFKFIYRCFSCKGTSNKRYKAEFTPFGQKPIFSLT